MSLSLKMIEALRKTLADIEQGRSVDPNDPAVCELRRMILLRIADLEIAFGEDLVPSTISEQRQNEAV